MRIRNPGYNQRCDPDPHHNGKPDPDSISVTKKDPESRSSLNSKFRKFSGSSWSRGCTQWRLKIETSMVWRPVVADLHHTRCSCYGTFDTVTITNSWHFRGSIFSMKKAYYTCRGKRLHQDSKIKANFLYFLHWWLTDENLEKNVKTEEL